MIVLRLCVLTLAVVLTSAPVHGFQTTLRVISTGEVNEITVTILDSEPPTDGDWTGYVIARYVHGVCEEPVFLTQVLGFHEPAAIVDSSPPQDFAYTYTVSKIGNDEASLELSGWSSIQTMGREGRPVYRGRLILGGSVYGMGFLIPCADMCWELPFLGEFRMNVMQVPDNVYEGANTDQVFDFYGDIIYGIEGPHIAVFAGISTVCEAQVSVERVPWSAVKALYR